MSAAARILGAVGLRLPVFGTNRAGAVPAASADPSAAKSLREDGTWSSTGGGGDVVGPASSVASEVALFDGTTGKLLKRATGTGLAKLTAGVLSAVSTWATSTLTGTASRLAGFDGSGNPTDVATGATGLALLDDATAPAARATIGATTPFLPGAVPTVAVAALVPVRAGVLRGAASRGASVDWIVGAAGSVSGTATDGSTATKPWTKLACNASTGSPFGISSANHSYCRIGHLPVFQIRIVAGAVIDATRNWYGLTSVAMTSAHTATNLPASCLLLSVDKVAGDTNFILRAKDATTQSDDISTGVAYVADHEYVLTLQVESATTVRWQVEDVTAVTTTAGLASPTTMPASTAPMWWAATNWTTENVAKHMLFNSALLTTLPY